MYSFIPPFLFRLPLSSSYLFFIFHFTVLSFISFVPSQSPNKCSIVSLSLPRMVHTHWFISNVIFLSFSSFPQLKFVITFPFYLPSISSRSIVIDSIGRLTTFIFFRCSMTPRVRKYRSPLSVRPFVRLDQELTFGSPRLVHTYQTGVLCILHTASD